MTTQTAEMEINIYRFGSQRLSTAKGQ